MNPAEVNRVQQLAHGAFGHTLSIEEAANVVRLSRGQVVQWQPLHLAKHIMRQIARGHIETWDAYCDPNVSPA